MLIGLSSNSLIFCERKSRSLVKKSERANCSWKRANCSHHSFVISDLSKSLTVNLLSWATWVNCSSRSLKKSEWAKIDGSNLLLGIKRLKTVRNIQKYEFFEQIARLFASNPPESQANHYITRWKRTTLVNLSWLLFCKEGCERIAHGRSFVKIDISESLTVTL